MHLLRAGAPLIAHFEGISPQAAPFPMGSAANDEWLLALLEHVRPQPVPPSSGLPQHFLRLAACLLRSPPLPSINAPRLNPVSPLIPAVITSRRPVPFFIAHRCSPLALIQGPT